MIIDREYLNDFVFEFNFWLYTRKCMSESYECKSLSIWDLTVLIFNSWVYISLIKFLIERLYSISSLPLRSLIKGVYVWFPN